jgi:uncharacterized cupredoxin-like copper-binding protein
MKHATTLLATLTAGILAVSSPMALADPGHGKGPDIGQPGEDHHVSRTYEIRMGEMYFKPDTIRVMPGETVRFIVINEGEAVHEFNIGAPENWDSHLAEMERMMDEGMIDFDRIDHARMRRMGMMHSDPNAVLLEPGERAEIVWTFPGKPTEMGFACNVPGHREAGMVGEIVYRGDS